MLLRTWATTDWMFWRMKLANLSKLQPLLLSWPCKKKKPYPLYISFIKGIVLTGANCVEPFQLSSPFAAAAGWTFWGVDTSPDRLIICSCILSRTDVIYIWLNCCTLEWCRVWTPREWMSPWGARRGSQTDSVCKDHRKEFGGCVRH